MKKEYFENRNKSIDSSDKDKVQRKILAEREIKTLKILQDVVNHNFYENSRSILDLGCGDQFLNLQITKDKKDYLGLDIDDLNFENDSFPLDDSSIDLILSYSVIEHIQDPSIFLNESLRVLKTGGYFVIETPNWNYSFKDFYNDYTHVKPYTPNSIIDIMKGFGFTSMGVVPNVRCKNSFFYKNKYRFQIASNLPFRNDIKLPVPSFLKGKAKGMFAIFKK